MTMHHRGCRLTADSGSLLAALACSSACLAGPERLQLTDASAWGGFFSGGPYEVRPIDFAFEPVGSGDNLSFTVTAAGTNAKVQQTVPDQLAATSPAVDAHAIQPYYTGLLAKSCGLAITLTSEPDRVVIAAA